MFEQEKQTKHDLKYSQLPRQGETAGGVNKYQNITENTTKRKQEKMKTMTCSKNEEFQERDAI